MNEPDLRKPVITFTDAKTKQKLVFECDTVRGPDESLADYGARVIEENKSILMLFGSDASEKEE